MSQCRQGLSNSPDGVRANKNVVFRGIGTSAGVGAGALIFRAHFGPLSAPPSGAHHGHLPSSSCGLPIPVTAACAFRLYHALHMRYCIRSLAFQVALAHSIRRFVLLSYLFDAVHSNEWDARLGTETFEDATRSPYGHCAANASFE